MEEKFNATIVRPATDKEKEDYEEVTGVKSDEDKIRGAGALEFQKFVDQGKPFCRKCLINDFILHNEQKLVESKISRKPVKLLNADEHLKSIDSYGKNFVETGRQPAMEAVIVSGLRTYEKRGDWIEFKHSCGAKVSLRVY